MDVQEVSGLLKVIKKEPVSIQIYVINENETQAVNVALQAGEYIKDKTDKLTKEGVFKNIYIDTTKPYSSVMKPNAMLNVIISVAAGIMIGLFLILFQAYMKENK